MKVTIFEDACATTDDWKEFNEETIKKYVNWEQRTSEDDDDQFTTIDWVDNNIASIPFCEGPHFIFICQEN